MENAKFSTFLNLCFVIFDGQISIYMVTKHFVLDYFAKNQKKQNSNFFIKNRGLTLQEKCQIFDFLKSTFFWFKMDSFLARTSQNTLFRTLQLKKMEKTFKLLTKQSKVTRHFILDYFAEKQKGQNFQFFIKNRGLTPLEKCQIFHFLTSPIFWFKIDSFLARTSQTTLFRTLAEKNGKKSLNF